MYKADPFVNTVNFYWPLKEGEGESDELRAHLLEEEAGSRCELLAERYDHDRASSLLATLDGGKYKNNTGPVMVLDLGFDALVVPFDEIETENMARAPDIWKQAIDVTLKNAKLSREEALVQLKQLEAEIAALEKRARDPGVKKKVREGARARAEERLAEKRGLLRQWFGKGSWGRAVLCGFAGSIIDRAGSFIPDPEPIKAKVASQGWCGSAKESM